MSKIAVMGCGWLGLPLAASLLNHGYQINGSTTSEEKRSLLDEKGIKGFLITLREDGIKGDIIDFLEEVEILIINIPPKLRGQKKGSYVQKLRHLHKAIKVSKTRKVILVSSTSVYGDVEGVVTENTKPNPATESGKQLLEAETLFIKDNDLQVTVIRFGGLIGPDRHPVYRLSGKKELTNGNEYVNLIHLDDCIRILEGIIHHRWWNEIFNGVYPDYPTKAIYYRSEAIKRGLPSPEYVSKSGKKSKKVVPNRLYNVKMMTLDTSIHL
ncbi:SDR family oxidoreductase [Pelagihabitans pacificus]|uniref:SDR family oxidoreductase n=1 Tax=Pelagihabitans pacificus TaxID=2696054 RepID=UPI001EE7CC2E|nr:SDR family oxidoreductase [Pelagihabitans pacificus]